MFVRLPHCPSACFPTIRPEHVQLCLTSKPTPPDDYVYPTVSARKWCTACRQWRKLPIAATHTWWHDYPNLLRALVRACGQTDIVDPFGA
jgi:hypothetical protein